MGGVSKAVMQKKNRLELTEIFVFTCLSPPHPLPRSKKYFFVRPVWDHSHFGNVSNDLGLFGDNADNNPSSPVTPSPLTGQAQFPATSVGLRSLLCQGCNLGKKVKHAYLKQQQK